MSIAGMAGRFITVYRRTSIVLGTQAASALMNLDRALQDQAVLQVAMSGGSGIVTINGVVDGVADTEELTFTGAETSRTLKVFSSVSQIDVAAGLVGSNITINSIGEDGSRVYVNYIVVSDVRMHINHGVAYWNNQREGTAQLQDVWFGIDYTTYWTPREGDVFYDSAANQQYMVTGVPEYLGSIRPHHWEVRAKRREGTILI